ncbi:ABC transporter ATP-binding protein [Nocardioides sp. CER19]|uniref:ABC transporter ATP-binding protein n=1 Tax=Nocardioides sp. CER19 TaxID=3038538 RepID=UPI002447F0AC|nr:ABC transporter ATP-binding protein [Nocardioides sp. CER19]MDH2415932.1 ABC transporter ATP-binding protein [Nocardioides sp. CER19]
MADRQRFGDLEVTAVPSPTANPADTTSHGTPPALEARTLYRFFRADEEETLALQGVTLALAAGELVALSGPSGSGKSTLLSCLAGTDEPSGGTVWIGGERISGRTEADRAGLRARSIGTMAQSGNLLDHLTVAGNIRLAQSLVRRRPADATQLLEGLGMAQRAHAYPGQLSGGERARASLAVAMANTPRVVLADEPTGELDQATEERLLQLLRQQARTGCAVLVASHSPAVSDAADRTLRLAEGRLV